jgi:hypothetical protein
MTSVAPCRYFEPPAPPKWGHPAQAAEAIPWLRVALRNQANVLAPGGNEISRVIETPSSLLSPLFQGSGITRDMFGSISLCPCILPDFREVEGISADRNIRLVIPLLCHFFFT